jgi:adenosylcobinamide-phosphate synthase
MFPVADRLLSLALGLALDAWLGDMPQLFRQMPHPVELVGRAVDFFDRKLNREIRSESSRRIRGVVTVGLLVGAAIVVGLAIERLCSGSMIGTAVEILLIAILLAQRSLFDHVARVARALVEGGTAAGREAVRHIVGRDPMSLDAYGVARAAIESLAENFSDGVVAPAFWYLVLGLPGLFAYKVVNTLDSMIGHATPRYRAFGWAAARFDDIVNLVPARISGMLIAAAALFSRDGRPARALAIMLRDGGRHRSLNAGWPEGAMAGALGLKLAGPRSYAGSVVADPWVGEGTVHAAPADIVRALALYRQACLIEWGLIAGAWLAGHGILLS